MPTTKAMMDTWTMFHLSGCLAGRHASLEVAIAVKSFTKDNKISTHVGKSNFNAMIERKKKPRMSTELAMRYST